MLICLIYILYRLTYKTWSFKLKPLCVDVKTDVIMQNVFVTLQVKNSNFAKFNDCPTIC